MRIDYITVTSLQSEKQTLARVHRGHAASKRQSQDSDPVC